MELLAWLLASIPILAGVVLLAQTKSPTRDSGAPGFLPYSKKKIFFSAAERSLYEILRRIAPDHNVFANVRLCDLTSIPKQSKSWRTSRDRKNLDFVICDATLTPVMAIELHSSHARAHHKLRDQFVDAALAVASIPVVRIPVKRSYLFDEVRRLIFPHVHGLGPVC